MKNDNSAGITGLDWDPRGRGSDLLVFADKDGYVGVFHDVYPSQQRPPSEPPRVADPLAEDSLLMEVRMWVSRLCVIPPCPLFRGLGKCALYRGNLPLL